MNHQTPGPIKANFSAYHGSYTLLGARSPTSSRYVGTVQIYQTPRVMGASDEPEREANARLLAASFDAFDKAGRELEIDAAELAERVDLAVALQTLEDFASRCATLATEMCLADLPGVACILNGMEDKARDALKGVQLAPRHN